MHGRAAMAVEEIDSCDVDSGRGDRRCTMRWRLREFWDKSERTQGRRTTIYRFENMNNCSSLERC
jgi:hypothetical protein